MDGIPVKINEKYKPPRRVYLQAAIINRLNNARFMDYTYDFSLENTVAEHMERLNKISREEIEKHDAKISPDVSPEKVEKPQQNYCENGGPSSEPSILTPVPISSNNTVTNLQKEDRFKYSDFENDTSSPFDNEELKTINDMEELAHVLGATSVGVTASQRVENGGNGNVLGASDWSQMKFGSPSQSQFYPSNVCYPSISLSTSHPSLNCPTTYSSQMPVPAYRNSYQAPNVQAYGAVNSSQPHDDRQDDKRDNCENEDGRVSEIVKSLQDYLGRRNDDRNDTNTRTNSTYPNNRDDVSKSFQNLNDQEQAMASRLAEMGFPLSRTTVAVRTFGPDESKIIEYLLLVQSFLDKGYSESQTIHALEVNQCDETQTEKYLTTLGQIMKLGFKEEEAITALAKTKNDRDKALDILCS